MKKILNYLWHWYEIVFGFVVLLAGTMTFIHLSNYIYAFGYLCLYAYFLFTKRKHIKAGWKRLIVCKWVLSCKYYIVHVSAKSKTTTFIHATGKDCDDAISQIEKLRESCEVVYVTQSLINNGLNK